MKMYYCAVRYDDDYVFPARFNTPEEADDYIFENNLHAYITIIKSNAENNWEKHSGFSYPQ